LIASVVIRNKTGKMQKTLKRVLNLEQQIAIARRNKSAALDGSVDANRNGDTAPIMSRTQSFNDPPLCSLSVPGEGTLTIQ